MKRIRILLPLLALLLVPAAGRCADRSAVLVHPFWHRVIGGFANGAWAGPDDAAARLRGGETFRLVACGEAVRTVTGGRPVEGQGCRTVGFERLERWSGVGIACGWDPLPEKVEPVGIDPLLEGMVDGIIAARGRACGCPVRRQGPVALVRADLDADGDEEVLASAYTVAENGRLTHYDALLVVFEPAGAGWRPVVVDDIPADPAALAAGANEHREVSAVLDADGDGRLEVVTGTTLPGRHRAAVCRYDGVRLTELGGGEVSWE